MKFAGKRRIGALIAAAAAVSIALAGCADTGSGSTGSTDAAAEGSDDLSVTFVPKNLGNPYFDASSTGGKAAVEEFGGTFNEVGPAEAPPTAR